MKNEETTVYRVFPSADGTGYSVSAEFNGSVEITHYDNDGKAISRTYGNVHIKQYKRFKIQICPVKEMYLIAKYVSLDNCAVIMCSSYPIDEKKVSGIKNKLFLEFDDITNTNSSTVFRTKDALTIKSFIDGLDDNIKVLYICCDSGESRSAALSAAIMRYLKMSDKSIWNNPYYHPNPLVYKIQCKAFGLFAPKIYVSQKVKKNKRALKKKINNV